MQINKSTTALMIIEDCRSNIIIAWMSLLTQANSFNAMKAIKNANQINEITKL